jgi:hypothetical protein
VDNFEIAAACPLVAEALFDKIDGYLTFPLKRMGLVTLFNRIGVLQTRDYIKISVETYIERICDKYLATWINEGQDKPITPLPNTKEFIHRFLAAEGDDNPLVQ